MVADAPESRRETPNGWHVRADPALDLGYVAGEARAHLVPVVAGMHQGGVGQVAEPVPEEHVYSFAAGPGLPPTSRNARMRWAGFS